MSLSISIIDGDDVACKNLTTIINSSHHCTLQGVAKNGVEARTIIRNDKTDVYLIDLGLPDTNGVELISLIKSSCKYAKILVVTDFGDARHVIDSIRAGASGYLLKEEFYPEFHEKIIAVSNGFSQISKTLTKFLFSEIQDDTEYPKNHLKNKFLSGFDLTKRELLVLRSLVDGMPVLNMAHHLEISIHTVNQHLRSIYKKLNVHSRSMAIHVVSMNGFPMHSDGLI